MGLKAPPSLAALGVLLRQGGPRAVRAARERMKKEAEIIADKARSNAPVLHHDVIGKGGLSAREAEDLAVGGAGPLERSIVVEKGYETSGRLQLLVNCGGTEDTDKYALLMEEGLAPYGSGSAGNLGPLSRQKAAGGHDVGGKFMERALNDRVDEIPANIIADIVQELEES